MIEFKKWYKEHGDPYQGAAQANAWYNAMKLVRDWMRNGGGAPADLRVDEELELERLGKEEQASKKKFDACSSFEEECHESV